MSYTIDLPCGCLVYVSCHPVTGFAHTRVVQHRSAGCRVRRHEVGARVYLWELLPDPRHSPMPTFNDEPQLLQRAARRAVPHGRVRPLR